MSGLLRWNHFFRPDVKFKCKSEHLKLKSSPLRTFTRCLPIGVTKLHFYFPVRCSLMRKLSTFPVSPIYSSPQAKHCILQPYFSAHSLHWANHGVTRYTRRSWTLLRTNSRLMLCTDILTSITSSPKFARTKHERRAAVTQ